MRLNPPQNKNKQTNTQTPFINQPNTNSDTPTATAAEEAAVEAVNAAKVEASTARRALEKAKARGHVG